ncbi:MAG: hypothetical protein HKM89_07720 [Gemmatimonadales bacterium]|nr:hypothetical protein [Gemmatimonadales bacterium]
MRALSFILVVSVAMVGCSKSQPTPPEVDAEFRALLETMDEELPGASAARLSEFMKANSAYEIVTEVEGEIERLRSLADGRYHAARELAREGDFDRAEAMLEDLATHLPETSGGESAKEHLAFDFYLGKAQWLMVRQRWEESGAVARLLLERDLTRVQREQVETILDGAGHVGAAYSQAERAQARAACRHLVIYLQMMYADEGQYPSRLSLSDVEEWDPVGSRSILRALSSIENYQQTDRGFSFTAVSARGDHRIRVVDGTIEE